MLNNFTKYELPNFGYTRLPKPPITNEDKLKYGSNENESNEQFLNKLTEFGFNERLNKGKIPKEKIQIYRDRIKLELDLFDELKFTDYILLVWKVINKAKEMGIFMDFGRGSVSSSLVATLVGICDCDAIQYNLFFSRFLSKVRAKSKIVDGETWISIDLAPDIDVNLAEGRDEIVQWLKEIYPNGVSKICNINTLTGKILIKDVYKTFEEASEEKSKDVSDMIERRFGVVQDIEEVYDGKKDETGKITDPPNKLFVKWVEEHKETYDLALKLKFAPSAIGCHASGYLVSFDSLDNHTPLILNSDREQMSAYTMGDVQSLKLDLLSLDTNRVIKNILEKTKTDVNTIDLESDEFIYKQLQSDSLLPYGLYQLAGDCAFKVCKHIKPRNVIELSHVNAIARPVGLMYEKPYLDNKEDCPEIFKECLRFSHYQPLYQENLIAMVKAIGFDEVSAEEFRRTFSKKKTDEIDKWMVKIKEKLKENNISETDGDYLLKIAKESASYQFNFSHSVSTSLLSSLTTYLKYKHPLEFYWACLNEVGEKPNKGDLVSEISQEMKMFNIPLLKPNIIKSEIEFKIENGGIRFGLGKGCVKGLGKEAVLKLQNFKHEHSNKFDLFVSSKEAGLNSAAMTAIIQSGCLDDFISKEGRLHVTLEYLTWHILTPREQKRILQTDSNNKSILGEQFNYNLIEIIRYLSKPQNGSDKPFIKEKRLTTLRGEFEPYHQMYKQNSKNRELTEYIFEKSLLGYSYSHNLFDILKKSYNNMETIAECLGELDDTKVTIGGELSEVKSGTSKNKNKYIKASLFDGTGKINIMIMEKHFEMNNELNNQKKLEDNSIIMAIGRKSKDIVFCDRIVIQDCKIIQKVSELKKKEENKQ